MSHLHSEAEHLRQLGSLKPNAERLTEVQEGLSSKWEGVQAVALQVLSQWGGRHAIQLMRSFLQEALAREQGWSIRGVAVKALAKVVGPDDAGWVLDLYFSRPGVVEKHELLPLVRSLPAERARGRLVRELSNDDPTVRQAAVKAIGNMPFADRNALLIPLQRDDDKEVRESARALTSSSHAPT